MLTVTCCVSYSSFMLCV